MGPNILVLGGNGFVGSLLCKEAAARGYHVIAVSRRGDLVEWEREQKAAADAADRRANSGAAGVGAAAAVEAAAYSGVDPERSSSSAADAETGGDAGVEIKPESGGSIKHIRADAANKEQMQKVFANQGPFHGIVHCIGILLDADSGLGNFNWVMSGSGSEPAENSTYDRITRETSFINIDLATAMQKELHKNQAGPDPTPFIFLSAAEAGWTVRTPVPFLERYLEAKRLVERKLRQGSVTEHLRPVVMRPTTIWTKEKPLGVFSALPSFIGNFIGLPFVDRPVYLENLVEAILQSISNRQIKGVQRYIEIDTLAEAYQAKTKAEIMCANQAKA